MISRQQRMDGVAQLVRRGGDVVCAASVVEQHPRRNARKGGSAEGSAPLAWAELRVDMAGLEHLPGEQRFQGPALLVEHGVISGVTVAITGQGRAFGILGAYTSHRRKFSEDEVHFLLSVATVLAMAVAPDTLQVVLRASGFDEQYRPMLRELTIKNYKSILDHTIELGRINVFIGENGCGKTNILEAVYLVATLRSFRGVGSAQMVRHGQKGYFVGSKVVGQGELDSLAGRHHALAQRHVLGDLGTHGGVAAYGLVHVAAQNSSLPTRDRTGFRRATDAGPAQPLYRSWPRYARN